MKEERAQGDSISYNIIPYAGDRNNEMKKKDQSHSQVLKMRKVQAGSPPLRRGVLSIEVRERANKRFMYSPPPSNRV